MPVRLGAPQGISGLIDVVKNPIYSTSVGLLLYGQRMEKEGTSAKAQAGGGDVDWLERIKSWFKAIFNGRRMPDARSRTHNRRQSRQSVRPQALDIQRLRASGCSGPRQDDRNTST